MIIIGVVGTLGAGKGTVVEYLVNKFGFVHYSVREFLAKELMRRGTEINRDSLTELANELRKENSPRWIVEQLLAQAKLVGKNAVVESIRTLGEVEALKKSTDHAYLFAIDADQKVRYERIKLRKSATDEVTFEKFLKDEAREMTSDDPTKQHIAACIPKADYKLMNNGSLVNLHGQIDKVMKKLLENDQL